MAWIDKDYYTLAATISNNNAGPHDVWLRVHEHIDPQLNKSRLLFRIWSKATSSSSFTNKFAFGNRNNDGTSYLKVNGQTIATFPSVRTPGYEINYGALNTNYQVKVRNSSEDLYFPIEIQHDEHGAATVTVTLSARFYQSSSGAYFDASWNTTLTLTNIPRGSFVSIDDGSNTKYRLFIDDGQMTPYFAYIDTGSWEQY